MFTGLVQHLADVASVEEIPFGRVLRVDASEWSHRPLAGESIAVNGCCLTVAGDAPEGRLRFDVIRQTLDVTTLGDLAAGDRVNLEHAVTPITLMGGHVVQGHIDGIAIVRDVERSDAEWRIAVDPPALLLDAIVEKGSVTLNGVSLTIATVDESGFDVALIPTTLEATNLSAAVAGTRLNIETDYVAKTVIRWLERRETAGRST